MKFRSIRMLVAVLTFGLATSAMAQPGEPLGSVSGTGTATISRMPEVLRMQVALTSKGATLKEALAALKTRSDAARLQVVTLGAEKDSVKIDPPRIAVQDPNQRMAMDMMVAQRLKLAGKGAAKIKAVAPPVEVTATLVAEWKLTAKDPEALLLATYPLQEKIRAADLAGKSEAEKLSPEQEELLEEQESSGSMRFSSNDQQTKGQPEFLFVSRISSAEHDKAMADAFKKAQEQAARVAKAAGSELGMLRSVSTYNDSSSEFENFEIHGYGQSSYRMMQQAARRRGSSDSPIEALGPDADLVKHTVSLNTMFDLKPGK